MAAPMNCQIMNRIFHNFLLFLMYTRSFVAENRHMCPSLDKVEFKIYWTSEFTNAPFINKPVLMDVNNDSYPDLIGATFTEVIKVIDGKTGLELTDLRWPYYLHDSSIYSSLLKHDINYDGSIDVLIVTSDAELIPLNSDGSPIKDKKFKLPPIYIDKYWYKKELKVVQDRIKQYVKHPNQEIAGEYVKIDAHILTTPVIADLNNDDRFDEIILPVSYFLDKEYYSLQESELNELGLKYGEIKNYLLGALIVYNMTSSEIIKTVHLDLTQMTSFYPGYLLFSPVTADLTSKGLVSEIILGTSAGSLHVFSNEGIPRKNFPRSFDSIHGGVTAIDINHDGNLELVLVDISGIVVCVRAVDGKLLWEQEISGTSTSGMETADLNYDGILDLIITTNDGKVWALNGKTGKKLPGWPIKFYDKFLSNAVIMKLNRKNYQPQLFVVVLTKSGKIHLISHDTKCRHSFSTGEESLAPLLMSYLGEDDSSAQFVIGTKDGALLCIGLTNATLYRGISVHPYESKLSARIVQDEKPTREVTGSLWLFKIQIVDNQWKQNSTMYCYTVRVYAGSVLLKKEKLKEPGEYIIEIDVDSTSIEGHVLLYVTNQYQQSAMDIIHIRINASILHDLKWFILIPFLANMFVLMLIYGFPDKNVLPFHYTDDDKNN